MMPLTKTNDPSIFNDEDFKDEDEIGEYLNDRDF
jgi:hypothetical protein